MPDDKTNPESAPTNESQKTQVTRREFDLGPRAERLIRDGVRTMIAATEKLVGVVASGLGSVAPHFLCARTENASATKMIGDATNSAIKKLRSDETSNVSKGEQSLGALAESSEKFQREKRMANMQSIVGQAIEQMPEQVPDTPVDHDWTARFFDDAKDVSNEEMQKLWAKLLAGEVERPGSVSLRTLDILRNMTQKEAKLFARVVNYIFVEASSSAWMFRGSNGVQAFPDISVDELYSLLEAGLIRPGQQSRVFTPNSDGYCYLFYACKKMLRLQAKGFDIPAYDFSISGTQLAKCIEPTINAEYLQQVADYIREMTGHAVEVADILAIDFESRQLTYDNLQKIAG